MTSVYSKIQWQEGMLLKPQHFQQLDRYHEHSLRTHILTHQKNYWGFDELELDQQALKEGFLNIKRASGYFPDGSYFAIPSLSPTPTAFKINNLAHDNQIFLATPNFKNERERYQNKNYKIENIESEIIETSELSLKIPKLELINQNNAEEYSCLLIAEFKIDEIQDKKILNQEFIPPLIDITAHPLILSRLEMVVEKLKDGIKKIKITPKKTEYTSFINFIYLSYLKNSCSKIQHLCNQKPIHPENLYLLLLELASHLSTIYQDDWTEPVYEHANIQACYHELFQYISQSVIKNPCSDCLEIKLQEIHPGYWSSQIIDKQMLNKQLILSLNFSNTVSLSPEQITRQLKIGTPKTISALIKQALPGIFLIPIEPSSLINHSEQQLSFLLDKQSKLWISFVREQQLIIHSTHSLGQFKIQLWAANA